MLTFDSHMPILLELMPILRALCRSSPYLCQVGARRWGITRSLVPSAVEMGRSGDETRLGITLIGAFINSSNTEGLILP